MDQPNAELALRSSSRREEAPMKDVILKVGEDFPACD
jgi:hypothetical protein